MPVKFSPGYMYSGSPASMRRRAPGYKPKPTRVVPRPPPVGAALPHYPPPDAIVGNSDYGGQYSGVIPPPFPSDSPPPPVDPYGPLSTEEIDTRATALANAGLLPQQDELRRQQQLAQRRAASDEAAISGFQTAAGQLLSGIAPEISAAYGTASKDVAGFGTAIGGQVGQDIAAGQAGDQAFAASQGQSGGTTFDPTAAGTAVGMLGGVLPGESLATEGAARASEAAANVAIPLNAGREELAARMAQATQENDGYAQQLIQLAGQFPGLKAQALQQLNQYELDKGNYKRGLASDAETARVDTANIAAQVAGTAANKESAAQARRDAKETRRVNTANIIATRATTKRENRAEIASEKAAGLTAAAAAGKAAAATDLSNYRWATLNFKNKQAVAAAKKAAAAGKRIDTQASKLLGHIVYKDGTEDPSIKVQQTAGTTTNPHVKAQVNRAKAVQNARQDAFKYAQSIIGKATKVDARTQQAARAAGKQVGIYVAGPNEKYGVPGGVFPPAFPGSPPTTNNPNRAARTGAGAGSYNDAQAKTWASIGGDSLMARYGYSREQVMAIVNRALAAAGWKRR